MPKFTVAERNAVKSIVAALSIKRISDTEIQNSVLQQTGKTVSRTSLQRIRRSIKKESYHWYKTMREGEYEYIHEFRERVNEIMELQRRHYAILDSPTEPTTVKQTSLAELHRLSITLSNLYDVAPSIVSNGATLPATLSQSPPTKATATTEFIV